MCANLIQYVIEDVYLYVLILTKVRRILKYFAAGRIGAIRVAKLDFVSLRHTSYSRRDAAPQACNLWRADRAIDRFPFLSPPPSPPFSAAETYESPARILEQFYSGLERRKERA